MLNKCIFPGPDVEQDSLGSVGSVNNMVGFAIAESSHGPGLAFSAGVDSDNSEDLSSSMSLTAASGPKVRYDRKMGHSWDKQRAKHLGGKSRVEEKGSKSRRNTLVPVWNLLTQEAPTLCLCRVASSSLSSSREKEWWVTTMKIVIMTHILPTEKITWERKRKKKKEPEIIHKETLWKSPKSRTIMVHQTIWIH